MPSRFEFERAIRASDLAAPARHIALTVATWADVASGRIPDRLMPSLTTLAEATGMGRSTLQRHLNDLESEGWVVRDRPDPVEARTRQARTKYRLRVPKAATVPEEGDVTADETDPRPTADLGDLDPERTQPRPRAGLDLGPERDVPRPAAGPKSSCSSSSSLPAPESAPKEPTDGTLFPVDAPAKAVTAGDLIARWIDGIGYTPPGNIPARMGRASKTLLTDGADPHLLLEAMLRWSRDRYARGPESLPAVLNQLMAERANVVQLPRGFRGGTRDDVPDAAHWRNLSDDDLGNVL